MGMYAEVLCIGPFRRELIEYYEGPETFYDNMISGNPIVTLLFGIIEGSSACRSFAAGLGISDPWDFNQHKINVENVSILSLNEVLSGLAGRHDGDYLRDLERLKAFIHWKYDLYFIPNG